MLFKSRLNSPLNIIAKKFKSIGLTYLPIHLEKAMAHTNKAPKMIKKTDDIRQDIELMFFAYRAFTRDADLLLGELGLGRAHHRVLHFVHSRPGMFVGELLAILSISKQSLNRVMRELQAKQLISNDIDPEDRRRRRLHLTQNGTMLAEELLRLQRERFVRAYRSMTPDMVRAWRRVLEAMLDEDEREHILDVVGRRVFS